MRLSGTIGEWVVKDPNAILTNRKFLQNGVGIVNFKLHDPYFEATYNCHRPDSGDPVIWYGGSCLYQSKGKFRWSCTSVSVWASGGSQVLSDAQADDPGWYKVGDFEKLWEDR